MSELLRRTALNAEQRRFADAVHQSGEHLLSIINDVLDFSKIEAGKLEIERIDFDLRQLLQDLAGMFAQPAQTKGLEIVCNVPDDLPVAVSGDPMRMRQILTNLVSNAVKFTSRGEIVIRVKLLDDSPRLARYRFEVEDSGIGIGAAEQARLFSAFVQADSSTTRRYGGSGLGLAIAKRLVELMHGQIGLHSEVGRGTLFWFEMPLQKLDAEAPPVRQSDLHDAIATSPRPQPPTPAVAAPPAAKPPATSAPTSAATAMPRMTTPWSATQDVPPGFGGRVLVVEDNPVNQQVAAAMLESLGVAYALADNGRIALDRVRQERFDLILMDCQMPEMDGFEATALIRARQCEGLLPGKLPIVALTANAVEGDRERCLAAGMDDYLSKPFTRERLATALGRWLPLIEDLVEPANPSETDTAEPPTGPARSSAINIGFLDQLRALDPAGGMGLTRKILQVYLDSSGNLIAQIEQAIAAGDGETVRRAAHSLKSSSANVGAETLSGCFKQLESMGRDGKLAKASTEFTETRREYEQAVIEIRTMLAEGA